MPSAAELKAQGAKLFGERKYAKALDAFTKAAAAADAPDPTIFGNRSAVHMALGKVQEAAEDAQQAIAADPNYAKGYYRLGVALEALKRWEHAGAAYRTAAELDPSCAKDVAAPAARCDENAAYERAALALRPRTLEDLLRVAVMPIDVQECLRAAPTIADLAARFAGVVSVEAAHPGDAKGRCLVAARDIPAMSLILQEDAVAWYPSLGDRLGATIPGLLEYSPGVVVDLENNTSGKSGSSSSSSSSSPAAAGAAKASGKEDEDDADEKRVFGVLLQLAPFAPESRGELAGTAAAAASSSSSSQSSSSSSAPRTPLNRADLILPVASHNVLSAVFDEQAPEDKRRVLLFCPVVDMANHSCKPNATYRGVWNGKAQAPAIRLVAERDIRKGEEITISYVDRGSRSKHARQQALKRFGFACNCERCAAPYDDSCVLRCPACKTGRVYGNARSCADCGADVGDAAATGSGSLWRAADAWMAGHKDDVQALALKHDPTSPHPDDQERHTALVARLQDAWNLSPAVRASVYDAVLASPASSRRGIGYTHELALGAGLMNAVAGKKDAAESAFRRCIAESDALFGPGNRMSEIAGECLARQPTKDADVAHVESKRLAGMGSWVQQGLPKKAYNFWLEPVEAHELEGGGASFEVIHALREVAQVAMGALGDGVGTVAVAAKDK